MSRRSTPPVIEVSEHPIGIERSVRIAISRALIRHHRAGRRVAIKRQGRVEWVSITPKGEFLVS